MSKRKRILELKTELYRELLFLKDDEMTGDDVDLAFVLSSDDEIQAVIAGNIENKRKEGRRKRKAQKEWRVCFFL